MATMGSTIGFLDVATGTTGNTRGLVLHPNKPPSPASSHTPKTRRLNNVGTKRL